MKSWCVHSSALAAGKPLAVAVIRLINPSVLCFLSTLLPLFPCGQMSATAFSVLKTFLEQRKFMILLRLLNTWLVIKGSSPPPPVPLHLASSYPFDYSAVIAHKSTEEEQEKVPDVNLKTPVR